MTTTVLSHTCLGNGLHVQSQADSHFFLDDKPIGLSNDGVSEHLSKMSKANEVRILLR